MRWSALTPYVAALLAGALAFASPLLILQHVAPAEAAFSARTGEAPAGDFIVFYGAGRLLASGGDPYDADALFASYRAFTEAPHLQYAPFAYPPLVLPALRALATLQPWAALWTWMAVAVAAAMCAAFIATREIRGALAALGFPGLGMVLACGQTSAFAQPFSAALAMFADRRPLAAGAALGVLALKPHLALGVAVLLALDMRWRMLAAAAIMAGALVALSLVAGGLEPWRAFIDAVGGQAARTAGADLPLTRMTTGFAFLRWLDAPVAIALAGHAAVAFVGFRALIHLWRSQAPAPRALAVALAPSFASPYLFDYDLAPLIAPFALVLLQKAARDPGRRLFWLAALAAAAPLILLASIHLGIAMGAPVVLALTLSAAYGPLKLRDDARANADFEPGPGAAWPRGRTRAKGTS